MKIFLSLCLLSVAMVMVSGMESFIDIHSGEHFDDVIGTTDGKKQFAIDVGLLLYKTSCTPKIDMRAMPPTHNLIFFQCNTEKAKQHVWYKQLPGDDLRARYATNSTDCQIAMYFKKGQGLRSKPTAIWDSAEEPKLDHWMWKRAAIDVSLKSTFDTTLGITTLPFEFSPRLKYSFLYPGETLTLNTYPGYEVIIHSTDKSVEYYRFIVQKKETITVRENMESQDIWAAKHKDWEKSHKWNQWAKSNSLRHLGNTKQPLFVHNYTVQGYRVKDIPTAAYKILSDYYKKHQDEAEDDEVVEDELMYINKFEVKPRTLRLSDTIIEAVAGYITPILESWCQCKLDYSAINGVTELLKGNIVQNHVTWVNRFAITAIMHLAESPANSSTPVSVVGYDGVRKDIPTKPGQMLLIESAKVIHGRPKVFQGQTMAVMEMSFIPREGWDYRTDGWDLVNERTGEEESLFQKETDFTKNKKMFTHDEL